jgi:hypothetical protein
VVDAPGGWLVGAKANNPIVPIGLDDELDPAPRRRLDDERRREVVRERQVEEAVERILGDTPLPRAARPEV